jgi:hypothetical protein
MGGLFRCDRNGVPMVMGMLMNVDRVFTARAMVMVVAATRPVRVGMIVIMIMAMLMAVAMIMSVSVPILTRVQPESDGPQKDEGQKSDPAQEHVDMKLGGQNNV